MSLYGEETFNKTPERGATTRHSIRVMVVGENSTGKTCLCRRRMNKETIEDVRTTNVINIERGQCQIDVNTGEWHFHTRVDSRYDNLEKYAACDFWDFAGRKEFDAIHQTFLSPHAVYLLVVDIFNISPKKQYEGTEQEFGYIEDYILFWLKKINSYRRDDLVTNARVIIVATGTDKISLDLPIKKDTEHEIEETKRMIQERLGRIPYVHETIHCVSNMLPSYKKQDFESLRKDIYRNAKLLTHWGVNLPEKWIDLEKQFYLQKSKKIILYTEASTLSSRCFFSDVTASTSELDRFLWYEHDIGNIVFFKDLKKSFIVLDPEWLVNVFQCFFMHLHKNESLDPTVLAEMKKAWNILTDKSLLNRKLKPDENVLHRVENFDFFVRLRNVHLQNYICIPCMIKPVPLNNTLIKVNTKVWKRTPWFCLEFCFLPPSYFNHILVFFAKNYKVLIKDKQVCISRNFGQFILRKKGRVILVICATRNTNAIQMRYRSKTLVCYSSVKNKLISLVHSLNLRYRMNIVYTKQFKCSDGDYSMKEGRVAYDIVLETTKYFCEAHNDEHVSKEIYNSWLTEKEVEEEKILRNRRFEQIKSQPARCHYCTKMTESSCNFCKKFVSNDCSRVNECINKTKRNSKRKCTLS